MRHYSRHDIPGRKPGFIIRSFLVSLLFFALIFWVSGCKAGKDRTSGREPGRESGGVIAGEQPLRVTVTRFPAYDFVRAIAGDRVTLTMLLPPGSESHSYEPTPRDIITLRESDIFIYTGGESDKWLDSILDSLDASLRVLAFMDVTGAVEEETVEGMEVEEAEESDEVEYDEHVWTSPKNAQRIVAAIGELLAQADPKNAGEYRRNSDAYRTKLEELDAAFRAAVAGGSRKTIIFADRFPFRYLADAYGLSYYAAFPGCSTETEPSAATVAFLIDKIRSETIPVVFHIELSNERMADAICEATGVKKLLLHSCHNISKKDSESRVTYMELMEQNVKNLAEALR